ncbi:acyl-CoA N-acyltransferase [Mycotypha africana]|uniref:acyl-CoA N-acyltransferase n=1 Tax=Mycotypha africana TaxID=64632 RepID=UPI002300658E|nr:acyl-CoA N-acyltransferase [Mycotypha africana]KAI8987719.1 acyl-CoA N-acyltransferase [Mycotypha africana]
MPNYINISVVHLKNPEELDRALRIRKQVFHVEQGYSMEIELDGQDDTAQHWVATCDKINEDGTIEHNFDIGVVRLIPKEEGVAKLGRLAVLPCGRGLSIGKKLVDAFIAYCKENGFHTIVLHSQYPRRGFYEKCGFSAKEGQDQVFEEAGTPHIKMWLHP